MAKAAAKKKSDELQGDPKDPKSWRKGDRSLVKNLNDEHVTVFLEPPRTRIHRGDHVKTEESSALVTRAAGLGLTVKQISLLLGISTPTVGRHYSAELETGRAIILFNVASNLYSIATTRDHPHSARSAMFFLKTQGGWREVTRHEHTGKDGEAIQHEVRPVDTINPRSLSLEDREALKQTLIEAIASQMADSISLPSLIEGEVIETDDQFEDSEDDTELEDQF